MERSTKTVNYNPNKDSYNVSTMQNTNPTKTQTPSYLSNQGTSYTQPNYRSGGTTGTRNTGYGSAAGGMNSGVGSVVGNTVLNNTPGYTPNYGTQPNYGSQPNNMGITPYGASTTNNGQYNPYGYATGLNGQNPYTTGADSTINWLMDYAKNPTFTAPYSTPEYQAYAAQSQRRTNQGIRAAQESLGGAGFGRSTALGERAQGIQNAETEYLDTQVIPQIIAAEQARRQQQFNNTMSTLQSLLGQQGRADNLVQQDFNNAITKGQLLGSFQDPAAVNLYNSVTGAKRSYADAAGRGDRAGMDAARSQADMARTQLQNMGYDTSGYGANVALDTALQAGAPSIRTLGGQEMDLNNKNANWNAYMDVVNQTGNLGKGPSQNWGYLVPNANAGAQTIQGKQYELQEQQVFSGLTTEQQQRDLATRDAAMQEWAMNGYATPNVAAAIGVPEGTPTSDQAYRDATQSLDQDKFTYAQMADAAAAQNQSQQQPDNISASTAGDLLSSTLQKQVGVDENGKPVYGSFTDPAKREQAFVDLYNNYGITGADMVTALTKAGYSAKEIQALKTEYPQVFQ